MALFKGLFKGLAESSVKALTQEVQTKARQQGTNMLAQTLNPPEHRPVEYGYSQQPYTQPQYSPQYAPEAQPATQPQYAPQYAPEAQPATQAQSAPQYAPQPQPVELETHTGCTCTCPKQPYRPQTGGSELDLLTVKELRLLARKHKIRNRSKMHRSELLEALEMLL